MIIGDPPRDIIDSVRIYSAWKRKFAWTPTKLTNKTIIFKKYYERTSFEELTVFGEIAYTGRYEIRERVETLFDVLKI